MSPITLSVLPLGILIAHLFGDYIFQNDWMAQNKTSNLGIAWLHGLTYTLIYIVMFAIIGMSFSLTRGLIVVFIIGGTHIVIDRWRLVKQIIWLINGFSYPWAEAKANNGYSKNTPVWMSTWLMIIVDNSVHLLINTVSIYLLLVIFR